MRLSQSIKQKRFDALSLIARHVESQTQHNHITMECATKSLILRQKIYYPYHIFQFYKVPTMVACKSILKFSNSNNQYYINTNIHLTKYDSKQLTHLIISISSLLDSI